MKSLVPQEVSSISPHRDSSSWLINTYDRSASKNDLHKQELGPGKYEITN
jgi:hypothetical protein